MGNKAQMRRDRQLALSAKSAPKDHLSPQLDQPILQGTGWPIWLPETNADVLVWAPILAAVVMVVFALGSIF
jgi:hypothetical protein